VAEISSVDAVRAGTSGGPVTSRRTPHRLPLAVVLLGAALTTILTWAAASANTSSDHRLLHLQVRQAASALGAVLPSIATPLTAAFDSSAATHNTKAFQQIISPSVGAAGPFLSVSLWQVSPGPPKPLVVVGAQPVLPNEPGGVAAFFRQIKPDGTLSVTSIIGGSTPRLGYGEIPADQGDTVLVYAESALPPNKKAVIPKNSGFSDLNFALYLGRKVDPSTLLETTGNLTGYHAQTSVTFGDRALTLVGTTKGPLAGGLSADLPLIAALLGALLTVGAAVTAEYLIRRRRLAEFLAMENARLYVEQRTIAETLQHSLLPGAIPHVDGLEIAVRYAPGIGGIEVGGDWYDVIPRGEGSVFFFVGDVSGRGLGAATTMGYLRHAIRAYAAQGGGPGAVLSKLGDLVDRASDGYFATVLCGQIDVGRHTPHCGLRRPLCPSGDRREGCPVHGPRGRTSHRCPAARSSPRDHHHRAPGDIRPSLHRWARRASWREPRCGAGPAAGNCPRSSRGRGRPRGQVLAELAPDGSDDDIAILGVKWLR